MRLQVGAITNIGCVRDLNEDVYLSRPDLGLFVVCDGMGGCPAGEVASQLAVEAILENLSEESHSSTAATSNSRSYLPRTERLAEAVRHSNRFIYDQGQSNPRWANMGTTVVGVWIADHIASVVHVGDSRAYLYHEDRLEPLTADHSLIEANHQNILLRVLGREPHVDVDVTEVPVQPGDYVLLCSDGLTRMVPEAVIAGAIVEYRRPQAICEHLIAVANTNGGVDNATIVVVQVTAPRWRPLVDAWRRQHWRERHAQAYPAV
jgi:protein phosphatase